MLLEPAVTAANCKGTCKAWVLKALGKARLLP
jgi:hypothetical protein